VGKEQSRIKVNADVPMPVD